SCRPARSACGSTGWATRRARSRSSALRRRRRRRRRAPADPARGGRRRAPARAARRLPRSAGPLPLVARAPRGPSARGRDGRLAVLPAAARGDRAAEARRGWVAGRRAGASARRLRTDTIRRRPPTRSPGESRADRGIPPAAAMALALLPPGGMDNGARPPIREWPAEDRPRERFLTKGAEALSDAECLALLLGSGAPGHSALDQAQALLATFGSLAELAVREVQELAWVGGIGIAKAVRLGAAVELSRRLRARPHGGRPRLSSPEEVAGYFGPALEGKKKEVFRVALLDS